MDEPPPAEGTVDEAGAAALDATVDSVGPAKPRRPAPTLPDTPEESEPPRATEPGTATAVAADASPSPAAPVVEPPARAEPARTAAPTAAPDAPTLVPDTAHARRRFRALAVLVGVPAFLVGSLIAAHGPIVRWLVQRRAASLGVELDFDDLDAGFGRVRLARVRASPIGVKGVRVTANHMTLETSWLSLDELNADGVAVAVEGPAAERVLDLAAWSAEHDGAYRLHGSAKDVRLEWRASPDGPAWLTMTGGSVTADGKSAELVAVTTAFGVPIGTVGASVAVDASGVTIEAGKKAGEKAPVSATLHTAARPPSVTLTLRPAPIASVAAALGIASPGHAGTASGQAELTLGRAPAGITGSAAIELDGWIPAHPRALDRILYGKKTTLTTRLAIAEDHVSVKLEDLEVRAGKLALRGSGSVAEEGKAPVLRAEVAGVIPCAELAHASAASELPGVIGEIAGEVAGRAVGGSATVSVSVEADPRNLAAAKVVPRVSVGCAVKLPGF